MKVVLVSTRARRDGVVTLATIVSLLVACSGSDGAVGGTESRVGQACSAAAACGPAEQCLVGEPGGLCVKPCTTSGSPGECPTGTLCDRDSFLGDDGRTEQVLTVCLRQCEKDDQCRQGYKCSGVSGGSGKVCQRQQE